jgi:uncharacterized protein
MHVHEMERERRGTCTALIFDAGDEVLTLLKDHARRTGIRAAHFTAIGAFQRAVLAYFDVEEKDYLEIPVDEQVEVTSLVGDIGTHQGDVVVHAHCVLGRRNGSAVTGHLLEGEVRPTLELFLTAFDTDLERAVDEATGLPLIRR